MSEATDEAVYLWIDGETLAVKASRIPSRLEIRFSTDSSHHILILHNLWDWGFVGALLGGEGDLIKLAPDNEMRNSQLEGGRFRVCLLDDYDDMVTSTLIDSFEHLSS